MNEPTSMTFLLGMAGALAPEIVRLYGIKNNPAQFTWSWFYLIVSILFAALGGLLAVLLPAANPRGAFYIGISTPVVINTALRKVSPRKKKLKAAALAPGPRSKVESFLEAL